MDRQPKLMSFSRMRDIFEPHLAQEREHLFLNAELGIVYGDPIAFRLVLQHQPPFAIDDHRLGVIVRGEICVNVNLVEKRLSAGTLVFLGPGTVISPVSISKNLEIYGIGLSSEFPMPFAPGALPSAFNGQVRDFQLQVDEEEVMTARRIIDTVWHVVHQTDYNRQTVTALMAALMHHYDGLYRQHADRLQNTRSREQTIFDRFIYLVNRHSQREHQIGFYADRMCLTERYLGTVVRQASGTTAKEWIDRAIVTRIKAELMHSNKTVAQIADEMGFSNPSFFSKYFRRLTGLTPQAYKNGG